MPAFLLAALVLGRGCPDYEIPAALSDIGISTRECFFGSQEAADQALREAAKVAGCYTNNEDPPGCVCPQQLTASTDACKSWAVNLVRFYTFDPAEESSFVSSLATQLAELCTTNGGVPLPPSKATGVDPDKILPACQRAAPAKTSDVAAFTAYLSILSAAYVFVVFENQMSPQ